MKRGYKINENQQRSAILFRVKHWVRVLAEASEFKRRSSSKFSLIAQKLGLNVRIIAEAIPRALRWHGSIMGETCLNIDGASQNEQVARGGLIRTCAGQHVFNFYSYYGPVTNNFAETRTLLDGIVYCKVLGITSFQVYNDSEWVVCQYNKENQIPWSLRKWGKLIFDEAASLYITIKHVYRELNQAADYLSKLGIDKRSNEAVLWKTKGNTMGG